MYLVTTRIKEIPRISISASSRQRISLERPLETCNHPNAWLVLQCRAQLHAPMLNHSVHSLLLTLPETPVLRYGDEIGMGDDVSLEERDSARTPMQWSNTKNAGFFGSGRQTDSASHSGRRFRIPEIERGPRSNRRVIVAALVGLKRSPSLRGTRWDSQTPPPSPLRVAARPLRASACGH
jgi:hypothetical protein